MNWCVWHKQCKQSRTYWQHQSCLIVLLDDLPLHHVLTIKTRKNRSLNSYINKFISLSCSSSSALMWSNIVLALGLKITGLLGTSGYISCDIYSADLTKETVPECKLPLACNWPNVHYSNSDIILVYDSILSTVFWFWAWIMHRATYCCFICLTSLDT